MCTRMQEEVPAAEVSTCSSLQASPDPQQNSRGSLLTDLLAQLENNEVNATAKPADSEVIPDTDPISSAGITSPQLTFSGSLGLGGVTTFSGSSCSQGEKGMSTPH